MDIRELEWEVVDWIYLAQDSIRGGKFPDLCATISYSRRILPQ